MAVALVMKKFPIIISITIVIIIVIVIYVAYTVTDCWWIVTSDPYYIIGATGERTILRRYNVVMLLVNEMVHE
jgi:hypothetical protein